MADGLWLVDIRSDAQRAADGVIPGAVYVPRNLLEWRLDPVCSHRHPDLGCLDARIALICNEGYQSSLAAATVARFGLAEVTDVIGGFQAWRAAGLPVDRAETGPA
jgi:rhodanese-related sulfurtransferase